MQAEKNVFRPTGLHIVETVASGFMPLKTLCSAAATEAKLGGTIP